jgi:predicted GNAT superfamily acetyltransferase
MKERILDDDHPVYFGYLYVCDGVVVSSDVQGTVRDLRYDLRDYYKMAAEVITTCDVFGRGLQHRLI